MALWDQLENESNAAYARFLAYRNLGPGRTLQRAYESHKATLPAKKRNKTKTFTQQWANDSTQFRWVERATAWDVENMLQQGERTATLYMQFMERYLQKLYAALDNVEPEKFDEVTKGFATLGQFFTPEVLAQLHLSKQQHRDDTPGE